MRASRLRTLYAPAAALALLAPLGARAQQISTGDPNPSPSLAAAQFGFGGVNFLSVGQSFVVPAGGPTTLTSFQFWLRGQVTPPGTLPYRAYIFSWDEAARRAGASPLFRSDAMTWSGSATNTPVAFGTGGVNLAGGQSYIAVLSAVEFPSAPTLTIGGPVFTTAWPGSSYAAGNAYSLFSSNTLGLGGLSSLTWGRVGANDGAWDVALLANFATDGIVPPPTTVPEPATLALAGSGLIGLGAIARRRRAR